MREYTNLFAIICIVCLPIAMLLINLEVAAFDISFFKSKYEEYNIEDVTGISEENLMLITEKLLDYLKGKRENIIIFTEVGDKIEQVFEERELLHLKDVRELFRKGYIIKDLTLLLSIVSLIYIFYKDRIKLKKILIVTSLIQLILMGLLYILIYSDFYKYFTYFHKILFSNDLWLLNPKTDILIQMYPLEFFSSITYRIFVLFLSEILALLSIALLLPCRKHSSI
ncbi:integral membrane protein TIGR01906 [Caloranaerobacter azorensis DSM 13643]|uniref:Integral membrane protein TIGR01906 n=1 Tax=Caloranaerobacter azorensis DSM 13643 TaxID=1121264 RepID=A0A1M5VV45_9FIRM|nr:TIGR01906 family membrane protein [Caloranaerobacter azorensis]SHH79169.1 integral membrane protein TIGR01906 [Caloranaerobacter azorensis DSM 13643]